MRMVNIDVFFEDNILYLRFDILDRRGNTDTTYNLHNLERFALKNIKGHQGDGSNYEEYLKYALTNSGRTPVSLSLKKEDKSSLALFDVTHSEKEIVLTDTYIGRKKHLHHVALFKISPDFHYLVNLLACLSLYFNNYSHDSIGFKSNHSFNKELKKDKVTLTKPSTSLLTIMQKILNAGRQESALAYEPLMISLQELADCYVEQRKQNPKFTFLDYVKNNSDCNLFKEKFSKIRTLLSMDFEDIESSLSRVEATKELLAPMSQEQAQTFFNSAEFLFNLHSQFKESIINFLLGKQAHDSGNYRKEYTEIDFLKNAEFILRDDGKISIINLDKNKTYLNFYAPGKCNHLIFGEEFAWLGKYFGGIEKDSNVHEGITFSERCTPIFMKFGFINYDLIKLFFYAYNRANFFAQSQFAPDAETGRNCFNLLPQELLVDIVKQSDERFKSLPPGFFNHAIKHGEISRNKRYSARSEINSDDISVSSCNHKI